MMTTLSAQAAESRTPGVRIANVLHVIPAIAARYGGPSAATLGLCRALELAGVRTLVATSDADGPGRLEGPQGVVRPFEGVRAVVFPRAWSEAYKWSPRLAEWLVSHVSEFDLVHVHAVFSHSSLAAGRACRRAGVPYIVRPLGTLDPWSVRQKHARKVALLRMGGTQMLRHAAAMHYTSAEEQRLAETVVAQLPQGRVVPLGVDDDIFRAASRRAVDDRTSYVLSMSRLDPKKGLEQLIAAFHQLAAIPPLNTWRLVIAGDGDPAFVAQLKAAAKSGLASARIEFAGWVGGEEKLRLLAGAGRFALPSHQENFGISVVEAMAVGVPVVVTPGVNLSEDIVRAGAGWVTTRDQQALADTLAGALADVRQRAERGRQARIFAERFRWPAVAASLIRFYDDVCAQTTRAVVNDLAG
jgi:glycosyltransferase involved in cell wall biosynthesis